MRHHHTIVQVRPRCAAIATFVESFYITQVKQAIRGRWITNNTLNLSTATRAKVQPFGGVEGKRTAK